ncbi:MAG: hypothetical protein KatS3mg076_2519 [Candidatus Binatia bacterium]|nr:MAG: hypothetical protein KatS3mg076_2519 [Candidatus Binatia bacterium]
MRRPGTTAHTILVIDDDPSVLRLTRTVLERRGHRVLTAERPRDGLRLFRKESVDLVLVDYFLPEMSGEEVVRKLREYDPLVHIILQTARGADVPCEKLLAELDVQGFHDKLEGPRKLLESVDSGLRARKKLRSWRNLRKIEKDPEKVLVVGPPTSFLALAVGLVRGGRQVFRAQDTGAALDLFVRRRPHAVVLDETLLPEARELVLRFRRMEPTVLVLLQCRELTAEIRAFARELELFAVVPISRPKRLAARVRSALLLARRLERWRAEQDLRALVLSKFAHELRNVMHAIQGYAEVLEGITLGSRVESFGAGLARASSAAMTLLRNYLDLVRLDWPGLRLREDDVPIAHVLAELEALAAREIGEREISFRTSPPQGGEVVRTDGEKLRTLLGELVLGALRACEKGAVHVEVRSDCKKTRFTVKVFFESADLRSSVQALGEGLGLAFAFRLAGLLGGSLRMRTDPRGTLHLFVDLPTPARLEEPGSPFLH